MNIRFSRSTGFTLLELMISVSLLAIILLASANIFRLVLNNQNNATIDSETQDNLEYALETIAKEIRGAQIASTTDCVVPVGHFFATNASSTELYFKNSDQECVIYYRQTDNGIGRLAISRNGYADFITSDKADIKNLKFSIDDAYPLARPLATINVNVAPAGSVGQTIIVQTSVTPHLIK